MLFVFAMLALDLGVFHKDAHQVERREALAWSAVWIGLAIAADESLDEPLVLLKGDVTKAEDKV